MLGDNFSTVLRRAIAKESPPRSIQYSRCELPLTAWGSILSSWPRKRTLNASTAQGRGESTAQPLFCSTHKKQRFPFPLWRLISFQRHRKDGRGEETGEAGSTRSSSRYCCYLFTRVQSVVSTYIKKISVIRYDVIIFLQGHIYVIP